LIIVDASGVLSALDADDPHHDAALRVLQGPGPRLLSPFVLAELDYLIGVRAGSRAQMAFLDDVADNVYRLEPFTRDDVVEARDVLRRYAKLDIGLADASLLVIAQRHGVHDLLTLDERHFRAILGPGDRPFRLLPADA
jgi:predicted nucleic acid-binding protein